MLLAPHFCDARQELPKTYVAVLVIRRKIGSTKEWLQGGRQKNIHGPAAAPGGCFDEAHVLVVNVGSLFAVHLNGDEPAIDQLGNCGIGIGLALHHVAPMAGVIADREKDRFVLSFGLGERLFSPGIPVDRVVRMQEEVRTLLTDQPVGVWILTFSLRRSCGGTGLCLRWRRLVRWSSSVTRNHR